MVVIYSPLNSPRLTYTVDLLAGLLVGTNMQIVHNKDDFLRAAGAKINYSNEKIDGTVQIMPCGLLWEDAIYPQNPEISKWKGHITLFPSEGDIPFDVLGAVFFLVTRYEEYYVGGLDKHNRFMGKMSFAYKHGFLELPIVNIWTDELRKLMNARFEIEIPSISYRFIPTIDIDQVYYYKHKRLTNNLLGGAKQLIKGQLADATMRLTSFWGIKPDPNDTFEWLDSIHQKSGAESVYFFYVGKQGPYDPQPLYEHKDVSEIIKAVSSKNKVGLHPSYNSFNNEGIIIAEKIVLEEIIGTPILNSRQHYLRFRLPETYRILAHCGIMHEYSMGYADTAGYRAGIAAPYKWFDLEKNTATGLTIHPFAVMDVTLKNYMQLTSGEAIKTLKKLIAPVKTNGGTFMSLWHNESVGKHAQWKGWREVYEAMISIGANHEN